MNGASEIWVGLHDQCQNGDSVINSLRINFRPLTSKIGLLEGKNPNNTVHLLELTRGPRNERRWQEAFCYQEFLRGGEILTTFLI